MSEITTAFDCRPAYIGQDGFPLRNGKLKFFDLITTNPKEVYSDYLLTTPLGSEITLENDGRSPTQLFYGEGGYSVEAYNWQGALDNQWVQSGQRATVVNDSVTLVNTIQDLRALDQNSNTVALLLGYYAAGDKAPILYELEINSDSDNGGTIVKNGSIAGKSWVHRPIEETVNAEIFGLIPNSTDPRNSQIQALVNYCYANKKTAYIQKGIYYFNNGSVQFTCPVSIDDGVAFRCEGGGSYSVKIYDRYDIRLTSGIKSALSTNDVALEIYTTGTVKPQWWGCKVDGSTDDSANFIKCLDNTKSWQSVVNINGVLKLQGHVADIVINRDILFTDAGAISNANSTYFVYFKSIDITNKSIAAYRPACCFVQTNLNKYKFEAVDVKASWFMDGGATDSTLNLSIFLGAFEIVGAVNLILDAKNCLFSTNLAIGYGSKYDVVPNVGLIDNQASLINFKSINGLDYVYSVGSTGNIAVRDGVTHFRWFAPESITTDQSTAAFENAIYCAMHGNFKLDLDGSTVYIGPTHAAMSSSGSLLDVSNGIITTYADTKSVFDFVSSFIVKLYIHDLEVYSNTNIEHSLVTLDSTSVATLIIERCSFISDKRTSMPMIQLNSSSSIYDLYVDSNSIYCYKMFATSIKNILKLIVTNNRQIDAIFDCTASKGTVISGNKIDGDLSIYDQNGSYYGVVSNNEFSNNVVSIVASEANSTFKGLKIVDNGLATISLINGTGGFAKTPQRVVIYNNQNDYGIAKKTQGRFNVGVDNSDIATGSVGDVVSGIVSINNDMLKFPDGQPLEFTGFGTVAYSGPGTGEEYTLLGVGLTGTDMYAYFRIDDTQPVGSFAIELRIYWGGF